MKYFNKTTIFCLIFALVLMIPGCNGPTDQESSVSSTSQGGAVWEKFTGKNMNGHTFKMSAHYDLAWNSASERPSGAKATDVKLMKYDNMKRIEEKYNVKFECLVIPWERMLSTLKTSVLAGAPYVDVVYLNGTDVYSAAISGYLLPLADITSEISDINTEQVAMTKRPKMGGVEYAFHKKTTPGIGATFMGFNQKIFDDLGLETPLDYYNRGEWTWANFLELAKKTTRDTNSDGQNDYWGYSGWNLAALLLPTNDAPVMDDIELKELFSSKNLIETVDFAQKFYQQKLVYMIENRLWNYDNTELFREGKSAMFSLYTFQLCDNAKGVPFDFHVLPFPLGSSSVKGTLMNSPYDGYAVPKGVQDPETVYQIFEELMLWYDRDFSWIETEDEMYYETGIPTAEDIERVIIAGSNRMIDYGLSINSMNVVWGNICNAALTKGQSVSTVIEANKAIAQAAIDDFFPKEAKKVMNEE